MAPSALCSYRANCHVSSLSTPKRWGLKIIIKKKPNKNRIIAWSLPLIDLHWFINQSPTVTTTPDANISALAYQLSNIYGVTFLLSVGVCYATTEPKVLRNYVIALGIGDVGHCVGTYWAIGHEAFVDVAGWNFLTWANFAFSVFLLVNRVAYLLGGFGQPKVDVQKKLV